MHAVELIARTWHYTKRNGIAAAAQRISVAARRFFRGSAFVLFYHDLALTPGDASFAAQDGIIERRTAFEQLGSEDLSHLLDAWNPRLRQEQFKQRFGIGASLWLFKLEGRIAAYGWSVMGRTVEPHFFPLGSQDVHLFDFFVFPEFRGRRLNPALVNHILSRLAQETHGRAFIEAAEWNQPQLASLARMPFRRLGCARKFQLFGRTFVVWRR